MGKTKERWQHDIWACADSNCWPVLDCRKVCSCSNDSLPQLGAFIPFRVGCLGVGCDWSSIWHSAPKVGAIALNDSWEQHLCKIFWHKQTMLHFMTSSSSLGTAPTQSSCFSSNAQLRLQLQQCHRRWCWENSSLENWAPDGVLAGEVVVVEMQSEGRVKTVLDGMGDSKLGSLSSPWVMVHLDMSRMMLMLCWGI